MREREKVTKTCGGRLEREGEKEEEREKGRKGEEERERRLHVCLHVQSVAVTSMSSFCKLYH